MHQVSGERVPSSPAPDSAEASFNGHDVFGALAGHSLAIVRVRDWLRGLAALRAPVLLLGEPGTGRRAAARVLHSLGPTPEAAFVSIAAGGRGPEAIPLRGTIHLHGVEGLPLAGQRRWQKFLESPPEATRLVASAGPLFSERITRDGFNESFGRALQRFEVRLPALRERPHDLPGLATGLLTSIGQELGRPGRELSGGALRRLTQERWPGNLNELRRVVERLVAYSDKCRIGLQEVEAVLDELRPSVAELRMRHQLKERETLIRNLEETGGNVTVTAERMQRSRAAIYRLVEKHGIALRHGGD